MAKSTNKSSKPEPELIVSKPEKNPVSVKKTTAERPAEKAKAAALKPAPTKTEKKAKSTSKVSKIAKDKSDTELQLASDIIADRIVPTIDQMKSVAAFALRIGEMQYEKRSSKKIKSKK